MAYARYIIPSTPATVANPATLQSIYGQTVAEIASVAGVHRKNHVSETLSVASVAGTSFLPEDDKPIAQAERYDPQADPNRCHVCAERETSDALFIAVLTPRPGAHHWVHGGACHDEHMRRCAARRRA